MFFRFNRLYCQLDFRLQGLEKYAEKLFSGDALFSRESINEALRYFRVIRSAPNKWNYLMNSIPFKKIMDSVKVKEHFLCILSVVVSKLDHQTKLTTRPDSCCERNEADFDID